MYFTSFTQILYDQLVCINNSSYGNFYSNISIEKGFYFTAIVNNKKMATLSLNIRK